MSKIIKEGELPVKRVKCDYCGCEFEYDKRDVEEREIRDFARLSFPPIYEVEYSVACPCCHTAHPLPADILDQLKAVIRLRILLRMQKLSRLSMGWRLKKSS
jgi:hypothetical protein